MEPGAAVTVELGDRQNELAVSAEGVAAWVRGALAHEGVSRAEISVVLVDDRAIRAINRRRLGHDWETDVITFPLSEPGDPVLAGELVISTRTAVESARELGCDPERELALYLTHGLLHLLGLDDQTEAGAALMRLREEAIMDALGQDEIRGLLKT